MLHCMWPYVLLWWLTVPRLKHKSFSLILLQRCICSTSHTYEDEESPNVVVTSSVIGSNPSAGVGKSKNTAPKSTLTQIRIYSIFFKNSCRTHFTIYTKELCIYLWERWRIFHLLWLCLKQQEEREVILFGLHHISLKIASLQQVCEWILTVFDQCNACQNSGGLTGKCVRFWCHSVSEVYLTGGGMGEGEKWIRIILQT